MDKCFGDAKLEYETVLVTGGAGFVGSNLSIFFKRHYPYLNVIALDNLKRRGSELNIDRLEAGGIQFVHGDIRNPEDLTFDTKIDLLVECSAEPSVLAGYNGSPAYAINTNLVGTINCLELARKDGSDIVFLSSSRVYPYDAINNINAVETETRFEWSEEQGRNIPGWTINGISDKFTLNGPKTIYGATKLCSEIMLQEYIRMYGIRAVINRCGVITGPWQFGKVEQGVVVLWVAAHVFKKELAFIGFGGNGKQVRDFMHIDDLFSLINRQLHDFVNCNGEIFNVGGGRKNSFSLVELTKICERVTEKKIRIRSIKDDRPGDINIYLTDNKKARGLLNWKPSVDLGKTVIQISDWVTRHSDSLRRVLIG